jgi:adenine-specific DNA methylase
MKYMGGKSRLLDLGLDEILTKHMISSRRFVDPFAGSAAVSHFVATECDIPVLAGDLQEYSRILAEAVITRTSEINPEESYSIARVAETEADGRFSSEDNLWTRDRVLEARRVCDDPELPPLARHYGGHYFSPRQVFVLGRIRLLLDELPFSSRVVALAALIQTASKCAASPGHTAQPFQPTDRLVSHIGKAWSQELCRVFGDKVAALATRFARVRGDARRSDVMNLVREVTEDDLVFLDPPYSSVHYGRFYHVLEGVALGGFDNVSGAGRMPSRQFRPVSNFSLLSRANASLEQLLQHIQRVGCKAILTLPDGPCSNGLDGPRVLAYCQTMFSIERTRIRLAHSTLGGPPSSRGARRPVYEQVLVLNPM